MAARTRGAPDPALDPDIDDQDIDDQISDNPSEGRRRRRIPIIPIIIILLVVGSLIAIFGFNVLNIRDRYIFPPLRGVPFVGNFIPAAVEYDYVYEYTYVDGEYVAVAVPVVREPEVVVEIPAEVEALMYELEAARAALAQAEALNDEHARTVAGLLAYRDFITESREAREDFEMMIALGDPDAFAAFFEMVNPQRAEEVFAHIRATQQLDREFRNYARTYADMSTDEAAAVFSLLLTQNPDLLIRILSSFTTAQRAEVFNEMEASEVAILTILMEPDTDPFGILPQVPLIDGAATLPPPVIPAMIMPDEPVAATAGDDAEDSPEEAAEE